MKARVSLRVVLTSIGIGVLVFAAVFGPMLWGHPAGETNPAKLSSPPSAEHPFGTDMLGRDILSRVLAASRLSLTMAVLATLISATVGGAIGITLAAAGRRPRNLALRINDGALAFPGLLFAIIIAAIFGPSATSAVVAVGIAGIPGFIRLSCNLALGVIGLDYVQNARVVGVGKGRLLRRYLLPNVVRSMGITATYDIGLGLVLLSSLSFLGLGVQLPQYDWGRLLAEGMRSVHSNPSGVVAPVLAITVTGLVLAGVGEILSSTGATRRRPPASAALQRAWQPAAGSPEADSRTPDTGDDPVVEVSGLWVGFPQDGEVVPVVKGVDLRIGKGEIVGLIGESGSGKTITAFTVADLLPSTALRRARRLRVAGMELTKLSKRERKRALADSTAMVFQEPMSSLNPTMCVGRQMTEAVRKFEKMPRKKARARAIEMLEEVRIPDPGKRLGSYPFELSGGMRQRVMIAMGLMRAPELLIADEPTTALDVTVQASILRTLRGVRDDYGTAVLLITHDLGIIREIADRVYVMLDGEVVEHGPVDGVLDDPQHPYTRKLLRSVPDIGAATRQRFEIQEMR